MCAGGIISFCASFPKQYDNMKSTTNKGFVLRRSSKTVDGSFSSLLILVYSTGITLSPSL